MLISDKISALRQLMKEKNIDVYIVPSADNHQSEYVGEHFKSRAYITGFTGSSGTAIITHNDAALWTDGRYFIQAEKELAGSGITLYKSGNPGVITMDEYLDKVLPENGVLGFDGRVISITKGKYYIEKFSYKNIQIEDRYDLIDSIWHDRPQMSNASVFLLDEAFTGESIHLKLNRVRESMKSLGATVHLLITLDDIAWLFNFRGKDVAYTPVVLSYAVITLDCVHLFIDEKKLAAETRQHFLDNGVVFHPYNSIYEFVANLSSQEVILLDPARLNFALYNRISSDTKVIEATNPCIMFKAMKNHVEVENIKKAHIKDAVAHTKFLYWLKNNIGKECITELSASKKLEEFRAEQEHFLWPSFAPISAFGAHAAMCHYSSSEETNCELRQGSFYLTDTGGHYMEGSTDITRTIALGNVSPEMKSHYTNVLRGNLALANATFLEGCTGENLDILARQFLWNCNLDYRHGTGHGIGYLLSIHEGPCRIKWQHGTDYIPLQEGMILSDEPGIYIENSYGIRLENELLVKKGVKNEYGQFMLFETITYVPFDLDAIDISLLQPNEKELLNHYHAMVYDTISPYLEDDEKEWLKVNTRAI